MSHRYWKATQSTTLIFENTWYNVVKIDAQKLARAKQNDEFIDLEVKKCID